MYNTLISCESLNSLINEPNVVIVDCRFSLADTESGRNDYTQSHIPGALYAHLDEDLSGEIIPGKTGRHPLPKVDDFVQKLSDWGIDESVQVVVYDQSHGGIAARLWWMLQWLGHEKVAVLEGGWKAWQDAAHPTDAEAVTPTSRNFVAKPNPALIVDANYVNKIKADPKHTLVDSRARERYTGEVEPIDPVPGHIPGASSAPFLENLEEGHFLSKEALAERFKKIGSNNPAESTIFYCGSGVTACHNLLAFKHAGLGNAKLYPGSWSEWITNNERATVTTFH